MKRVTLTVKREGERLVVRSPSVGVWYSAVREGQLVDDKRPVGELEILGQRSAAVLEGVAGRVLPLGEDGRILARPVDWDAILFELDTEVGGAGAGLADDASAAESDGGNVFRSPSSGRFYSRPEPDKPAFVAAGDIIESGHPVCMLEVMKTYSRVRYDGERARVVSVRPADQDDLEEGDVILELEPV